ncbi:MAG: hypothetical protein ABFR50_10490 [Candidatus Fermentibacteria bacterium]
MVVHDDDIGNAIEIQSFSWKRSPSPDDHGTFYDMKIYMGLCASDQLGMTFDDNFIPGTRILVLSGSPYSTQTVAVNEWFEFTFDTPFWYNGQDNLLIEIQWSSGSGSLYSWNWNGGSDRCVYGHYGQSSGLVLNSNVPNLRLDGTLSLSNTTFARIKAAF